MTVERDYTHASFFSGIGAFDLGLEQAGFRVVSHAEVKPFSCAVLETRWPGVPNLGDINAICPDGVGEHECEIPKADVWTGGFPCSDFSIMGKRKGLLGGNRSSLGLVFLDLVRRHRPPYVILENVPGILSSHEGRDFGLLLGALVDIGYGWSYRLLDARNFGLPQARRRVFVVAALDAGDAGAVLDDATDRRVDVASVGGPRRAVVARGGAGAASRPEIVIGPTYSLVGKSVHVVRTDGTSYPLTPSNSQYVIDGDDSERGPVVAQLSTRRGPVNTRDDGSAYTIIPDESQWVVDASDQPAPIVIRREGTFEPGWKRDGSSYTILPTGSKQGNIGEQYVVVDDAADSRGPGPVVLYPTFSKRDQQRLASRADGASYTLLPGATPYVLEPGDFDDLDDILGGRGDLLDDGLRRDDAGGRSARVNDGSAVAAGPDRAADDGDASGGPSPETDADGVRAAAGISGRLDDPDGGSHGGLGPKHFDTARWHVLGRACPVPIVEWMGLALRTVIDRREADAGTAGK